jgi:hypothetical protein
MMKEIPHDEWSRFLEEFSRSHHGWLVWIEQYGAETGSHADIHSLPLEGMSIQLDGHDETLAIIARSSEKAHGHLLFNVAAPIGLRLEQSGRHGKPGRDKKLHIDSSGAPTTVVAFKAAPPIKNIA